MGTVQGLQPQAMASIVSQVHGHQYQYQ